MKPILFSDYGKKSARPSFVNTMMSNVAADFRKGYDINLGTGYVNEQTIPRSLIGQAMEVILSQPDKYPMALNYGGPRGSANLINSIKDYYLKNRIGGLSVSFLEDKEIIIGASGATSLLESITDVLEPGIVLTASPMYYIFCDLLERKGFTVLSIPEDEQGIDTTLLKKRLDNLGEEQNKVRFLYIITINNPTSSILSNKRREELVHITHDLSVRLGREVPLIFDKAYEDLIHDPAIEEPRSGFLFDKRGLVYELGTFSKVLSPALRCGYLIGKKGALIQALIQKTSDTGFSAPKITQELTSYLLNNHISTQLKTVNNGYRQKALEVGKALNCELGPLLAECSGGSAGFYYYLTFNAIDTGEDSDFFNYCTRTTGIEEIDGREENKNPRVLYIPGIYCVHHSSGMQEKAPRQLRISYGYEETGSIHRAVKIMKDAAEWAVSRKTH